MNNKKRFLSFKDMTKKDYGKNAIIGLLGGGVLNMPHLTSIKELGIILGVLGGIISIVGLYCGIIWLYKTVSESECYKNKKCKISLESISNNKRIIIVVLVLITIFYWFAWRPAHIRQICATQGSEKIKFLGSDLWQMKDLSCLKINGLKE